MPYGYLGAHPNQQLRNSGVYSPAEIIGIKQDNFLGGSLIKVAEVTTTGATTIELTDIQEDVYNTHFCLYTAKPHATGADTEHFSMRVSVDNGSSWKALSNYGQARQSQYSGGVLSQNETSGTAFNYFNAYTNQDQGGGGWYYLHNFGKSNRYSQITGHGAAGISGSDAQYRFVGGSYKVTEVHNAIQFYKPGGEQYMGTFTLYGVKE